MAINSMSSSTSLLGQSVLNIKNQLNSLQVQLATGEKATTYSGMGVGEGFAVAARAQLANITGYQNTITNVTTTIAAANAALQGIDNIGGQIQTAATSGTQTLNSNGQTTAQNSALAQFGSMVDLLNTQAGNGYIFSGNATNTAPVAPADQIINGNGGQAGLKQIIAERQQADLGTATPPTGRLVITGPSGSAPTTVSVGEDFAGSPFGMKLASASVSQDMINSCTTVNGPTGSPASISVTLGANPVPGDQVNFTFNMPDGTTATMQLTATTTSPPPAGSFTIGSTPAATAGNLNTALNSSISTIASTTLVAASAMAAGNDFFGSAGAAIGTKQNNQAIPVPVTGATLLSGVAGGGFTSGASITVNGQAIQFYNSAGLPPTAAGSTAGTTYLDLATTTVSNLLTNIDTITGTSAASPSTISGGVVTLNDDAPGGLSVTSSPSGTLAALGFSGPVSGATAAGSVIDTQASLPAPAPISGSTLLSGAANLNSLTAGFASGDSISVNGKMIQFYSPPATAGSSASTTYLNLTTATIGNLLSSIDAITGTSTPSTVSGGVVSLQSNDGAPLTVSSSNTAAFAALGFGNTGTISATVPPLRVFGSPLGAATSLVSGTPANTVTWYTGGTTTGSPRGTQVAQIDPSQTVNYGIQANEQGIRSQMQAVAVFAAFSASATNPSAQAQVAALSTSVGTALSSAAPGQQTMQDIQSDLANAQTTIKSITALQTQTQTSLQDMVSQIETVSPDQVASEILSLQTQLQASYQTTSMLSQLSLVKFLPTP
jgi:flagellar hook-associated protein 3 FlgL